MANLEVVRQLSEVGGLKVGLVKIKVIEAADAAALVTAYEAWTATLTEEKRAGSLMTYHDGTNIGLVIPYTEA